MEFIGNLSTHTWDLEGDESYAGYIPLNIGFVRDNENPVVLTNVFFGVDAVSENKAFSAVLPEAGIVYIDSDQKFVYSHELEVGYGENWTISVWAEEAGQRFDDVISVTTKIPDSPYPSWTWDQDAQAWVAPYEKPDDGNFYTWNEQTGQWEVTVLYQ